MTPWRGRAKAEIRQLVQARHDRQVARGETPVEVDVEVERLLALEPTMEPDPSSGHDELSREEVRQLVIARNDRRMRAAKPPLDVEAEVERQLRDLAWAAVASGHDCAYAADRRPIPLHHLARGTYFNPQTEVADRGRRLAGLVADLELWSSSRAPTGVDGISARRRRRVRPRELLEVADLAVQLGRAATSDQDLGPRVEVDAGAGDELVERQ